MEQPKRLGLLKWATIIGIVVVLNLFFSVAIALVYPEPEFTDFCEEKQVQKHIGTEEACVEVGGQWTENQRFGYPRVEPIGALNSDIVGYCNQNFECGNAYQEARDEYKRNVFIALVALGVLSLVGGVLTQSFKAVSAGLSYGGVLTFIIASMRYWDSATDIVRLVIVGVALIILIVIAARKFRE